jgi:hypothetical protein
MKLRTKLLDLAKAVADAADRDPELASRLSEIFGAAPAVPKRPEPVPGRAKNRRPAAVLDPVVVVGEGEDALRSQLSALSLDQLRDVVAEYGMDQGKLVMKWKDPVRIIDRIVEIAVARAQKGHAFRSE